MIDQRRTPVAWVESPLQLLCAAEYAAALGRPIAVAFRLTGSQMTSTAHELLERGALFSSCAPYFGIPWSLLSSQPDWIIGDGFSGQFRLAASVLRPRSIALVDDGDMTVHLAAALLGRTEYARPVRPGHREGSVATALGAITRARLLRLAGSERLTMFSAFAHDPALLALAARDVPVAANDFEWSRAHARPARMPHPRVVLGTARIVDGLLDESDYLLWLRTVTEDGPISYLPHRREDSRTLARVAELPGVAVVDSGLPAELALAGTSEPLEIVLLRSSAATTLRTVLAGTGSTVRLHAPDSRPGELVR
ncbi:hypothetical protein ACFPJ4_02295 [Lysinimonas soli]|uniref:Uncharacterized protein n=1 Tax=Lysinimonas soli TaxID=1074233 RepID=A0ABW0NKE2_9MICO